MEQGGYEIGISWVTFTEAHTLVLRRFGAERAFEWARRVLSGCVLLESASNDLAVAFELTRKYGDRRVAIFDALTAVAGARLGARVWTFDSDFEPMGVTLFDASPSA